VLRRQRQGGGRVLGAEWRRVYFFCIEELTLLVGGGVAAVPRRGAEFVVNKQRTHWSLRGVRRGSGFASAAAPEGRN